MGWVSGKGKDCIRENKRTEKRKLMIIEGVLAGLGCERSQSSSNSREEGE
jgi:hypothetical protein